MNAIHLICTHHVCVSVSCTFDGMTFRADFVHPKGVRGNNTPRLGKLLPRVRRASTCGESRYFHGRFGLSPLMTENQLKYSTLVRRCGVFLLLLITGSPCVLFINLSIHNTWYFVSMGYDPPKKGFFLGS